LWEESEEKFVQVELELFVVSSCILLQEMKFRTTSLIRYVKSIVEWCSSVMGKGIGTREEQSHRKGHVHRYFWEVVDVYQQKWYE
jgi:hypothetical protein